MGAVGRGRRWIKWCVMLRFELYCLVSLIAALIDRDRDSDRDRLTGTGQGRGQGQGQGRGQDSCASDDICVC